MKRGERGQSEHISELSEVVWEGGQGHGSPGCNGSTEFQANV